jgi:hypothetical protein
VLRLVGKDVRVLEFIFDATVVQLVAEAALFDPNFEEPPKELLKQVRSAIVADAEKKFKAFKTFGKTLNKEEEVLTAVEQRVVDFAGRIEKIVHESTLGLFTAFQVHQSKSDTDGRCRCARSGRADCVPPSVVI